MKGGVSVMARGGSPLWRVEALGGKAVRLPLAFWWDEAPEYLRQCRAKGYDVLAVMDRDSFPNWSDWRHNAEEAFVRVRELHEQGLIQAVALGNEWDDGWQGGDDEDDPNVRPRGGVSSWTLPFSQVGEMIVRAHDIFRPGDLPILLGGMSSGQPSAIDRLDLSRVNGLMIHPYGKRPEEDWPTPSWGFGFVGDWVSMLQMKIQAQWPHLRLGIGELGVSSYDTDEGTQAEWFKRMLNYFRTRGDIDFSFVFCDSDQNVDGYGLFKVDERPKAAVNTVAAVYLSLPPGPLLDLGEGPDEPVEPVRAAQSPLSLHLPDADDMKDDEYQAVLDLRPSCLLAMCYMQWDQDKGAAARVRDLVRTLGHTDLYVRFHANPNPPEYAKLVGGPVAYGALCAQRMNQYYAELGVRLHVILANETDADYEGNLTPAQASNFYRMAIMGYRSVRPNDVIHVPAPTGAPQTHREHLEQYKQDGWVEPDFWIDGHGYGADFENVVNAIREVFPGHRYAITETNGLDNLGWPIALLDSSKVDHVFWFILNWARGGPGRVQPVSDDDAAKRMSILRHPTRYAEFKATIREPEPVDPGDDDDDEPEGWWDDDFSAEEIAEVLAGVRTSLGRPTGPDEVVDDIRANWGEFGRFMAASGVQNSVRGKIALLATIWVETGWEIVPKDEIGSWDYFERNYGYQTSVGRMLGNIYPGDGARYHGRGYQLTGRDNYAAFGELLDVPLIDMPDEANDPTVAAACIVAFFTQRGIFAQAEAGNWEQVRRLYNGGLNGWDGFIRSVNALIEMSDADPDQPDDDLPTLAETLRRVMDLGATRIGDPYVWDGERPGAFDCSGFIKWCYAQALGIPLTSYTDAIYDETDAIAAGQALAGDIVLYEYLDPSQPGVRFPHVGLVTERPDITLDARGGVGVGYHANVYGAARYYRRVRGLDGVEDDDVAIWKPKAEALIGAVAYLGDNMGDSLEGERAQLDDYGAPPKMPKAASKMLKADWEKHAEALEAWAKKVRENTDARYQGIGAVGSELRRVRAEFVGPRPA